MMKVYTSTDTSNQVSLFRAWREVVSKLFEYESRNPDLLNEEIDWYVDRMKRAFSAITGTHAFDNDFEYTREHLHNLNRKEASD